MKIDFTRHECHVEDAAAAALELFSEAHGSAVLLETTSSNADS